MVNVNPANAEMNISSTKNLSHLTSAGSLVLVTELAMSVRVKRVTKEAIERGEVVKEVVGERYFEFENMTLTDSNCTSRKRSFIFLVGQRRRSFSNLRVQGRQACRAADFLF
jgi:hypothetical protein